MILNKPQHQWQHFVYIVNSSWHMMVDSLDSCLNAKTRDMADQLLKWLYQGSSCHETTMIKTSPSYLCLYLQPHTGHSSVTVCKPGVCWVLCLRVRHRVLLWSVCVCVCVCVCERSVCRLWAGAEQADIVCVYSQHGGLWLVCTLLCCSLVLFSLRVISVFWSRRDRLTTRAISERLSEVALKRHQLLLLKWISGKVLLINEAVGRD